MSAAPLGWAGIARLGLVQAALGAVVVLATSTMNRVMVVEWHLPAILPGALVAWHYGVQILRPKLGYRSDLARRRTPFIAGGMAVLAAGGILAALATVWMAQRPAAGIALAVVGFGLVGLGVGACGTALLVLLAQRVAPARRGAAATIVWVMMIAGIALTATLAGRMLDPFSPARLLAVTAGVGTAGLLLTLLAIRGMEPAAAAPELMPPEREAHLPFRQALASIWADAPARRFTLFVFVSMLAYSAQELILEPFAGAVFHFTPGESARLIGLQHGGVLAGMLLVAVATGAFGTGRMGALRGWTVGGCLCSALAILGLAGAAWAGAADWLRPALFVLGVTNGAFAVSAIGAMMGLAHAGRDRRAGTRMGLWGAAQAVAFGLGGLLGSGATDLARARLGTPDLAYAVVFAGEAALFLAAAVLAARVFETGRQPGALPVISRSGAAPLPGGG